MIDDNDPDIEKELIRFLTETNSVTSLRIISFMTRKFMEQLGYESYRFIS